MGLDTTHDCWHGAYSAFSRWRNAIAEAAGYQVVVIKYEDGTTMTTPLLDWGHQATDDHLAGRWERTPEDPILVLLVHSDCDGFIFPEQAGPLASALERLLPTLEDGTEPGHIGSYRAKTQQFIDGLRAASAANEPVEFA